MYLYICLQVAVVELVLYLCICLQVAVVEGSCSPVFVYLLAGGCGGASPVFVYLLAGGCGGGILIVNVSCICISACRWLWWRDPDSEREPGGES